ncbi:uncharacterized protein PG986_004168 [Apiospora aurea]|uniref:Uncharacterized protein n=1 Tax=Apiospora aurea TaxID=335848 RepID=A0ABR1QLU1_9PEZI
MQFFTISAIAFPAAGAAAMPNAAAGEHTLQARCAAIFPACNGGHVVGQTSCRCEGQKEKCDVWSCPGDGENTVMVCGQAGTGCI